MIVVRTPKDELFNYAECEELFNECKEELQQKDFKKLLSETFFYSFNIWKTGELLGCIFFYYENKKLFVGGFAGRKHHFLNVECLKESLKWFNCNIYSNALHRTSSLILLRSGFERLKNNLFIYRRKK